MPTTVDKSEEQQRYAAWIRAIAYDVVMGTCPDGILEHIQKHAGPDLLGHVLDTKRHPDASPMFLHEARRWSASMANLLALFDQLYLPGEPVTIAERLARLQDQYDRKPQTRTPDPSQHATRIP